MTEIIMPVVCVGYINAKGRRVKCNRIKKDGAWVKGKRTGKVSHGLCPDCLKKTIKE